MKAMVLAAGLGTRLRPLTNDRPKALVTVAGRTLLEITLSRLRAAGVTEAIVNVHHLAGMMTDYLEAHRSFGMRIEISREDVLLDTGGGLKKAAWFFLEDGDEGPFLLHNVDVLSTIDLGLMIEAHRRHAPLATLAVQDRSTSRYLLFDGEGRLAGRQSGRDGTPEMVRPAGEVDALAFNGIHVFGRRLLERLTEDGVFSIVNAYLRLAGEGGDIRAFRADPYQWRDLGRPESIERAAEEMARGGFPGS